MDVYISFVKNQSNKDSSTPSPVWFLTHCMISRQGFPFPLCFLKLSSRQGEPVHTSIPAPEKVLFCFLVPGGEGNLLDITSLEAWLELCSPW